MSTSPVLVKLGGAVLEDLELVKRLCGDLAQLRASGVPLVIVHGGGPAINQELRLKNIQWQFIEGQRVTTPEMMDVIETVLCGTVNRRIVRALGAAGARAVGISGADAQTLLCTQASVALGQVGVIDQVQSGWINSVLKNGMIPVIAPIGVGPKGEAYNINADWAASRVAQSLGVEQLIFLTDQDGILDASSNLIPQLDVQELESLIGTGVVQGGMLAKTRTIVHALRHGVAEVRIMNARRPRVFWQHVGTECRLEIEEVGVLHA